MLTQYIKKSGKQQFEFKVEETGDYLLNFAIRDGKKQYENTQTFYIDNFEIADISNRNLDLTADNLTFIPEVLSYNDYYPFGMLVPTRHGFSNEYRYGFNGKEKDDEIKNGDGNSYDFGGRNIYDSRTGRFNSIDPLHKKFPWYSPYLFAGNTPIMSGDESGLYPIVRGGKIVGYVIEPGQGPTQIAKDINDPATQAVFGYCLEKKITWDKVVSDNILYYAKSGHWEENTNLMDKKNLIYRDLNSNAGDELKLRFDEEPDVVQSVRGSSKDISVFINLGTDLSITSKSVASVGALSIGKLTLSIPNNVSLGSWNHRIETTYSISPVFGLGGEAGVFTRINYKTKTLKNLNGSSFSDAMSNTGHVEYQYGSLLWGGNIEFFDIEGKTIAEANGKGTGMSYGAGVSISIGEEYSNSSMTRNDSIRTALGDELLYNKGGGKEYLEKKGIKKIHK